MRNYIIDELKTEYITRLKKHLIHKGHKNPIADIYWFELPQELLSEKQLAHYKECGPHMFTLETGRTWIKLELLVRAQNRLRCSCLAYASSKQRYYIIEAVDNMLKDLDIPV